MWIFIRRQSFSLAFTHIDDPPTFCPESGSMVLIALGNEDGAPSAPARVAYPRGHPLRVRLASYPDADDFLGKYRPYHLPARVSYLTNRSQHLSPPITSLQYPLCTPSAPSECTRSRSASSSVTSWAVITRKTTSAASFGPFAEVCRPTSASPSRRVGVSTYLCRPRHLPLLPLLSRRRCRALRPVNLGKTPARTVRQQNPFPSARLLPALPQLAPGPLATPVRLLDLLRRGSWVAPSLPLHSILSRRSSRR